MARVTLMPALRVFTDGVAMLDTRAATIQDLFDELGRRFPALQPELAQGIAVAIDGVIHQDQLFATIAPGSDVHLIPAIAGG